MIHFSLGKIYRRGARRWRKIHRVNGHSFVAKRFSRVSNLTSYCCMVFKTCMFLSDNEKVRSNIYLLKCAIIFVNYMSLICNLKVYIQVDRKRTFADNSKKNFSNRFWVEYITTITFSSAIDRRGYYFLAVFKFWKYTWEFCALSIYNWLSVIQKQQGIPTLLCAIVDMTVVFF